MCPRILNAGSGVVVYVGGMVCLVFVWFGFLGGVRLGFVGFFWWMFEGGMGVFELGFFWWGKKKKYIKKEKPKPNPESSKNVILRQGQQKCTGKEEKIFSPWFFRSLSSH